MRARRKSEGRRKEESQSGRGRGEVRGEWQSVETLGVGRWVRGLSCGGG